MNKILLQDESINSSKTLIKKNKNQLSSARSLYTPKLDLTLPFGREILINNGSDNTELDYYEVDAKISQNIYDFGATSSKIDIAKNQLELSEISSDNVKSNKILEALSAYLNFIKTFNILQYAKESENRIKTVTRLENEKVAKGAGLASNVLQSKARLAGARSTRVKFEGDLAIAKNRFFNVFREIPAAFSTFKQPSLPINLLPSSEEEAIRIAKDNNIALKISNLNIKNSKTKIKGNKAKFLPSLKAVAQYKNKRNVSGLEGTEIDHIYKLEMKYPISIGGPFGFFYKENADYKSSMNQYMITKYNHDQLERNLEESVRNSWQTKNIAKQNYEFLENQANISGEFFDLAMKEVKLGNRQLIDILSSETAYINSKSAAENAKTEYQLAVYQLLFAIGILDEKIFKQDKAKLKKGKKIISNNYDENTKIKIVKNKKTNLKKEIVLLNDQKLSEINKNNDTKNLNKKNEPKYVLQDSSNPEEKVSKPITLVEKGTVIIEQEENNIKPVYLVKKKNDPSIVEKGFPEDNAKDEPLKEKKKANKNLSNKEYKIQLGAFGKFSNADKFLNDLVIKDLQIIKLFIEEDNSTGLFKIKSVKGFSKDEGKSICINFKNININCILSLI